MQIILYRIMSLLAVVKHHVIIKALKALASRLSLIDLIVLGFNDTSTLEGHFASSPREREKRDRRESRGDEREGQGKKRNRNESEETEEKIKTFPPLPLSTTRIASLAQL